MNRTQAVSQPSGSIWLFRIVLMAYLLGATVLNRRFSRVNLAVGGIPLFVGELTLAILLVLACYEGLRVRSLPFTMGPIEWGIAAYMAAGFGFTIIGWLRGYGLAAMRDAALTYYALMYLFVLAYVGTGGSVESVLKVLSVGAVGGSALVVSAFFVQPVMGDGHASPSYQALAAWVGILILGREPWRRHSPWRRLGVFLAMGLCLWAVYLSAYRTMALVVAGSVGVLWLGVLITGHQSRLFLRNTAITVSVAAAALGTVVVGSWIVTGGKAAGIVLDGPASVPSAVRTVATRWMSLAGVSIASPEGEELSVDESYGFRQTAWSTAVARIAANPLTGIGFGPAPALFPDEACDLPSSPTSNCGNAHNTFLTIAMRMGLPVLTLFLGVNGVSAWWILRKLNGGGLSENASERGLVLLASMASFAIYGLTSLLLESPYLSSIYWVLLALASLLGRPSQALPGRTGL